MPVYAFSKSRQADDKAIPGIAQMQGRAAAGPGPDGTAGAAWGSEHLGEEVAHVLPAAPGRGLVIGEALGVVVAGRRLGEGVDGPAVGDEEVVGLGPAHLVLECGHVLGRDGGIVGAAT